MPDTDFTPALEEFHKNRERNKRRCTINIVEVDDRLHIFAEIPVDMEDTIAGALAHVLMAKGTAIMNDVMNETQTVEKINRQ
jgi:hypothetical protein